MAYTMRIPYLNILMGLMSIQDSWQSLRVRMVMFGECCLLYSLLCIATLVWFEGKCLLSFPFLSAGWSCSGVRLLFPPHIDSDALLLPSGDLALAGTNLLLTCVISYPLGNTVRASANVECCNI